MQKINKKLTIIKYGTAVLMSKDGSIDKEILKAHGEIINNHKDPILMISSGAVGFGSSLANFDYIGDEVVRKRALACLGNPHLSMNWDLAIKDKSVLQALVTHRGLQNAQVRGDMKKVISEVYRNGNSAIIQFNENDFVSDAELKEIRGGEFGDNDRTATLITELCLELFNETELVINTSSDGVLDENGNLIKEISVSELTNEKIDLICKGKTGIGTGGMKNKLKIIKDLETQFPAINTRIINGKKPNELKKVLGGYKAGTLIVNN